MESSIQTFNAYQSVVISDSMSLAYLNSYRLATHLRSEDKQSTTQHSRKYSFPKQTKKHQDQPWNGGKPIKVLTLLVHNLNLQAVDIPHLQPCLDNTKIEYWTKPLPWSPRTPSTQTHFYANRLSVRLCHCAYLRRPVTNESQTQQISTTPNHSTHRF